MNPTLKGSLQSKIVWLGLAVSLMGYLQTNIETLAPFIPQKYVGLANIALGGLVIVARFFTAQSLSDKGTPQ